MFLGRFPRLNTQELSPNVSCPNSLSSIVKVTRAFASGTAAAGRPPGPTRSIGPNSKPPSRWMTRQSRKHCRTPRATIRRQRLLVWPRIGAELQLLSGSERRQISGGKAEIHLHRSPTLPPDLPPHLL